MEYLLGSLLTLISVFVANRVLAKKKEKYSLRPVAYSQSIIYEILAPFLPTNEELSYRVLKTQATKHKKETTTKVLFIKDKAYWIQNNSFYTANFIDGSVDEESATKVDIMGMDAVQLKEMSFIVEKLTEGLDDENRYSGK